MEDRREAENRLRENILSAMVEAALQGHDLGPFGPVDEPGMLKYQAVCQECGRSVYVSHQTLYSILDDKCPGEVSQDV